MRAPCLQHRQTVEEADGVPKPLGGQHIPDGRSTGSCLQTVQSTAAQHSPAGAERRPPQGAEAGNKLGAQARPHPNVSTATQSQGAPAGRCQRTDGLRGICSQPRWGNRGARSTARPTPSVGLGRRQVGRQSLLVQGGSQDVLAVRRELDEGHGGVVVICTGTEGLTRGAGVSARAGKETARRCSAPREAMPPCRHHHPEGVPQGLLHLPSPSPRARLSCFSCFCSPREPLWGPNHPSPRGLREHARLPPCQHRHGGPASLGSGRGARCANT